MLLRLNTTHENSTKQQRNQRRDKSDAASYRLLTHYSNSLSAPYNNRKSGAGASRRQATTELRGAKQPPITCRV
ncbi:hypothetical protein BHM03_00000588, partial [Ensete ventricosum]